MTNYEWPASDYAIGSYIQSTVATPYLEHLILKPNADVLDIGCGDASFSTKILEKIPTGRLVGLDRSLNMLQLAAEKKSRYPQLSLQQGDVLTMDFNEQFDEVVSFWCLQWCFDLEQAYNNIYRALKTGGHMMTLLPSGDDPFMNSFKILKASGNWPVLDHFMPSINYQKVHELPEILAKLPFKKLHIERPEAQVLLPSLDIFRKFLHGLAFFQTQLCAEDTYDINEALVDIYDNYCQAHYQGEYWFNFSIYYVTAEK